MNNPTYVVCVDVSQGYKNVISFEKFSSLNITEKGIFFVAFFYLYSFPHIYTRSLIIIFFFFVVVVVVTVVLYFARRYFLILSGLLLAGG